MTILRLMIGAGLVLIVSACTSAGERRVDQASDVTNGEARSSQPGEEGADSIAALRSVAPDDQREPAAAQPADRDGDLVSDANDECQDSAPGSAVDAQGCAIFSGVIEGLEFAPDGDTLSAEGRAALDGLIKNLAAHPQAVIAVDGHTDNRGLASNNLDLSKRRVIAVVRYLVEQGVPASRLKPYGYGESRPLKSNATPEGRQSNRRIEVREVRA